MPSRRSACVSGCCAARGRSIAFQHVAVSTTISNTISDAHTPSRYGDVVVFTHIPTTGCHLMPAVWREGDARRTLIMVMMSVPNTPP
jgi:hypothetical protein